MRIILCHVLSLGSVHINLFQVCSPSQKTKQQMTRHWQHTRQDNYTRRGARRQWMAWESDMPFHSLCSSGVVLSDAKSLFSASNFSFQGFLRSETSEATQTKRWLKKNGRLTSFSISLLLHLRVLPSAHNRFFSPTDFFLHAWSWKLLSICYGMAWT